ncbi:hypothetical protein QF032_000279 [Streptomyces achromogenes]|uniref:hypothetical protein n=1 Tax=Streptomyces achromogenes TaxID=67255 RepID=UPI0027876BFC|nr:hypothetical protein [Streptomyces achromogenes]MDQ0828435.1 hypothetical protein [Streptomyces achromogenes]
MHALPRRAPLTAPRGLRRLDAPEKDSGPESRQIDEIVVLLGVADMAASKRFSVERVLKAAKGFGGKYVEFDASGSPVKLSLYGRRGLAEVAGVPPEGAGSSRLAIGGDAEPCAAVRVPLNPSRSVATHPGQALPIRMPVPLNSSAYWGTPPTSGRSRSPHRLNSPCSPCPSPRRSLRRRTAACARSPT